ncbi:MAG TPA: CGNR zinc finger domain-containing protein [Streptosporangiaceae bacterium]|nr:CGNR zinc finger domain-containing protein [Streptosporangiaceae bacterium]
MTNLSGEGDTSRNATRRFCSTSCRNRVKTAAFRAARRGYTDQPKNSSASA